MPIPLRSKPSFHALLLCLAAPVAVHAQRTDTLPVLLPNVSVTATRIPITPSVVPVSATVFDRAMLRAAGLHEISDVLRLVPGATVLTSGSFGSQSALFLRGGESDYVQVLVDGVPLNSPGGAFDFGHLTLENVERVEVVRGPASVLYGSDAMVGVIQIFTRVGAARSETRLNGVVGAGNYGTRRYEAGLSGSTTHSRWSLDAAQWRTAGVLPFNNSLHNDVASGAWRLRAARVDVGASARWTDYVYHYPTNSSGELTDSNAFQGERRILGTIDAGWRATPRLELRLRAARGNEKPRTRDLPDFVGDENAFIADGDVRRDTYEGRLIADVGRRHFITVDAERTQDRETSTSESRSVFGVFADTLRARRDNRALAAQIAGNLGARATYMSGVRRDHNSAFGWFTTHRIAAAVRIGAATSVRASRGTGFKAPTFLENFANGYVVGNRNLAPERSTSMEFGVEHVLRGNRTTLAATVFTQRFRNLIQYLGSVAPGEPNYANLAAAASDGIEVESKFALGNGVSTRVAYTYLRTKVLDAGADEGSSATFVEGEPLLRRPTHLATGELRAASPGGGSAMLIATYTGARDDRDFSEFPARPVRMKAFWRTDVSLVQPLDPWGLLRAPALTVRVENIFNNSYQQILGFRSPGRTLFVGLRVGD